MSNVSIPRTKIDCFTMDALEQIKAVVNNETPQFTNRGGVGKDVRELSDFALQQIKDAVGTNGGGVKAVMSFRLRRCGGQQWIKQREM